jgi:hypothetical protein
MPPVGCDCQDRPSGPGRRPVEDTQLSPLRPNHSPFREHKIWAKGDMARKGAKAQSSATDSSLAPWCLCVIPSVKGKLLPAVRQQVKPAQRHSATFDSAACHTIRREECQTNGYDCRRGNPTTDASCRPRWRATMSTRHPRKVCDRICRENLGTLCRCVWDGIKRRPAIPWQ